MKQVIPYEEILSSTEKMIDFEKRTINTLQPIKALSLPESNSTSSKEYVEFVKTYIYDIVADGSKRQAKFITKWISKLLKGGKNKVALVIVSSTEGIGKTSLIKIISAMIGQYHVTNPSPTSLCRFNFQCFGKLLVVLEETEGLQKNEGALNDTIKNLVTEDTFSYESKGIQPKNLPNINNLIMTSNFTLSTAGRRFNNMTPSTDWLGDVDKWNKLYDFTDENVRALYDYFMSIDTNDFNEEEECRNLISDSGNLKEIEKMNTVWKFIKDFYLLEKKDIKKRRSELYEEYKSSTIKPMGKSSFTEKLKEIKIKLVERAKLHGVVTDYFIINWKELFYEFKKRKYLQTEELEQFKELENESVKNKKVEQVEIKEEFKKDEREEMQSLKKENDDLRKKLDLLTEQMAQLLNNQKREPNRIIKVNCKRE